MNENISANNDNSLNYRWRLNYCVIYFNIDSAVINSISRYSSKSPCIASKRHWNTLDK